MELTFKKWVNSAVVTSLEKHPEIKKIRHHSGLSVIYNGKNVMHITESGFFIDNNTSSTDWDEAERMLWNKINSI